MKSESNPIQNTQTKIINEFVSKYGSGMNEINVGILLKNIKSTSGVEVTHQSKELVKQVYSTWFQNNFGMDTANIKIFNDRCISIFGKPIEIGSFKSNPLSSLEGTMQNTQTKIINEFVSKYGSGLNEINVGILLKNIKSISGGEVTGQSMELVKQVYSKWFQNNFGMDTANIKIFNDRCISVFGKPIEIGSFKSNFNNLQDMSEYVSKLYQLIERQQEWTKLSEDLTIFTDPTDIHNFITILGVDPRFRLNSVNEALNGGIKLIQNDLVIEENNLATQAMSISTNTAKLNKNKVILEQTQKKIANIESEGRELKLKVSSKTEDNKFKQEKYQMQCESNKHMVDNMSAKQTSFILQKSIEQNNHEFVKIFINKDFNPNFQNANGESLLHTAVKLKDAIITQENQLLEKVIAKNPDKNLKDKDGNTVLLLAVKAQDFYLMDKLMTPEGLYVSNLNDESPFAILETQLFNAVDSNNIEFIQKLSLIVPDYSRFSQNEKPLLYAALEQNKLEIAKLFLAGLSAEQTLLTAVQLSNIGVVQKLFTLINTIDFNTMEGHEIISTASEGNNPDLIELLNTMGADIEVAGGDGLYTH